MLKTYIKLLLLLLFFKSQSQGISERKLKDSIQTLRALVQDEEIEISDRIVSAEKVSKFAKQLDLDSLLLINNRNLSYLYYTKGYSDKYTQINFDNLNLAKKLSDTSGLATAYFNLGGI